MKRKLKKVYTLIYLCLIFGCGLYLFAQKKSDKESCQMQSSISVGLHYSDLDLVKLNDNKPNQIRRYTGFNLSYNRENHTPNWVAWELLGEETQGDIPREKKFWHDEIVEGCAWHEDYKKSGYDRGHMIPAADQKWDSQAMFDSFVMANVCPQNPALNSGAWSTLENKTRQWAERDSCIIIVAGPIYNQRDVQKIGKTKIRVPSAFFKVIVAPYVKEPRGIGFVYPNMPSPGNMQNYIMTIDAIEELSNMDFFYNLPDEIENKIEAVSSFKMWNKND